MPEAHFERIGRFAPNGPASRPSIPRTPTGWRQATPGARRSLLYCGALAISIAFLTTVAKGAALSATTPAQRSAGLPARIKTTGLSVAMESRVTPLGPTVAGVRFQSRVIEPPLSMDAVADLKRNADATKGRLQVGVGRVFTKPVSVSAQEVSAGEWTSLPSGWRVYALEVTSAGAVGLRVHLDALKLPAGARLIAYDPANPQAGGTPVSAETLAGQQEVWTETIFADRVVVECQVPPGVDPQAVSFRATGVSHLYQSPLKTALKEGACNNDVTCFPDWAQEAAGTARILFIDSGSAYLCTGCLLNANNPNAVADYFLTANHCIGSQAVASSLEVYWFYQTSTCNGPAPSVSSVPHTVGGADYLAGSPGSDFAFMRLRQPAPNGVFYLGWTTTPTASGDAVIGIHHPDGSYKRISFGNQVGTDPGFWSVHWTSGVTEPGSSGSPLLNANHQVVGQLYGGASSCSTPDGLDMYGRFDVTYNSIKQWLDPSATAASPTTAPAITPGNASGPITPVRGTYTGLFQSADGVTQESAGLFTITTTPNGRFSGSLQTAQRRWPFTGKFSSSGTAQVTIKRRNTASLNLVLQLDPQDVDRITGTVSDGSWTADLAGDRSTFNARLNLAPQAGQYTMVLPGAADPAVGPGGDSYGTVSVSKSGRVRFAGSLADGTRISQAAPVSKNGQWPLYVRLYGGQGLILSWMTFTNAPDADLTGSVSWIKSSSAKAKYYSGGFAMGGTASGSLYVRPTQGSPVLSLPQASVVLDGGNLPQSITNSVALLTNNRVTDLSGNKLTLSFIPTTGLFRGSTLPPAAGKPIRFGGAVLQKSSVGRGCFMGATQSGSVLVEGTAAP